MSEYEQIRGELLLLRGELADQRREARENSQAVAALAVASGKQDAGLSAVDERSAARFSTLEKRSNERYETFMQLLEPNGAPAFRERARAYFVRVDENVKKLGDVETKLADAMRTLDEYKRSILKRDALLAALVLYIAEQFVAKYLIK